MELVIRGQVRVLKSHLAYEDLRIRLGALAWELLFSDSADFSQANVQAWVDDILDDCFVQIVSTNRVTSEQLQSDAVFAHDPMGLIELSIKQIKNEIVDDANLKSLIQIDIAQENGPLT